MSELTDEQVIALCAEAMGIRLARSESTKLALIYKTPYFHNGMQTVAYDPLHDDAQAMALVKVMQLYIIPLPYDSWNVHAPFGTDPIIHDGNLNRAICLCVAQMQRSRPRSEKA